MKRGGGCGTDAACSQWCPADGGRKCSRHMQVTKVACRTIYIVCMPTGEQEGEGVVLHIKKRRKTTLRKHSSFKSDIKTYKHGKKEMKDKKGQQQTGDSRNKKIKKLKMLSPLAIFRGLKLLPVAQKFPVTLSLIFFISTGTSYAIYAKKVRLSG